MNEKKKPALLVVSQYFYPEQFRINDMCEEWIKRGYDVTVVTGIPNYPQGKYFDGYGLFRKRKEIHKGVRIIRLPIVARGKTKVGLAANYLSFVISGFIWSHLTRANANCVFVNEISPMTQSLVGVWFGKRRKIPVIHYVTDLWPENVVAVSGLRSKRVIHAIGSMVDYIYRHNDLILTSSNSFVSAIQQRGVDTSKVRFWPHYAEDYYFPVDRDSRMAAIEWIPSSNVRLNIAFTGNLGMAQGLDILPKVAAICKRNGIDLSFNMIGEGRGKDQLVREVVQHNVTTSFRFIPRQPAEEIPFFLAQCDVGLVMLSDNPVFAMYIPTKLQSYMACGIPILACGEGEMCEIVTEAEAGYCAINGDPEALAEIIAKFASLSPEDVKVMSENSLSYFQQHFDKQQLMDEMDEIIINTIKECDKK